MTRESSPLRGRVAFLVGVRRSGTNWLRRIVDAHPDAVVIPAETYLLSHGIAPLCERVQHGLAGSARTGALFVDRDGFLDAVRDLCDQLLGGYLATQDRPVQVLAERTPDHVRQLDLIADLYPDASVVHIIRDGRDVARSLVSQDWGPTDHAEAAEEWVSGIEAARRAAPRLSRYLEVSYETLLAAPEQGVPALYRFLGLDASDAVVARALAEADVPYNVDPRASGVTAAKWRGGLDAAAVARVLEVAGPLLAELGYEVGDDKPGPATGRRGRRTTERLAGFVPERRRRADADLQRTVQARLNAAVVGLDEFLADVAAHRFDDLARHFTPEARVRVIHGAGSWDERGAPAVDRLGATLAADPALHGRQLRGDVHPGVPACTVVATWESDGATHDRVLVVTRYADRIAELVWYVLPRLPTAPIETLS